MRQAIVICLAVLFGFVACRPGDTYETKYDNVDVDEILHSERLLNNYFNCLMTGEACTPDGREMKGNLPDALQTGCSKCSEKQREISKKILTFILKNKPEMYKKVQDKYDPEGIYAKQYKAQLEAEGIKIPV